MAHKFHRGDHVAWGTPQGETTGKVVEVLTSPADFMGHHFNASDDDPRYKVESDKSGKHAVHTGAELRRRKGGWFVKRDRGHDPRQG